MDQTLEQQYLDNIAMLRNEITIRNNRIQELLDMMPDKSRVIVSRKWNNPAITVEYNNESVNIHMKAEDYIKSVLKEAEFDLTHTNWKKWLNWHPLSLDAIEASLINSMVKIEEEMKDATKHFPPK